MANVKTRRFDIAELLEDEDDIIGFLAEVQRDGTPEEFIRALGVAARARGMAQLARETGLCRDTLYKALSGTGNPGYLTVDRIARALGFVLMPQPLGT
jgi:probable addiction module antidote protein